MNKYVALLLLVWGSLIAGCMHTHEPKLSLAARTKGATVALVDTIENDTQVGCSGVWANEDTIITARHCVEGVAIGRALMKMAPRERILAVMFGVGMPDFKDEDLKKIDMHYITEDEVTQVGENPIKVYEAVVLALDSSHDLAALKVKGARPRHLIAPVAQKLPATGEEVVIVGHTKGLYWTYMKGTVSNVRARLPGLELQGPWVQVIAPIAGGNSGGGAFDSHGCLVGIVSFTMTRAPNEGFLVHPDTIHDFLKVNKIAHIYVQ